MFRRRNHLSFSDSHQSIKGIFSISLAGVTLILFLVGMILTCRKFGNAGVIAGSCGFMAMLFAALGTGFGIGGILEEGQSRLITMIGTIVNGLILSGMIIVFIAGLRS